MMTYVPTGRRTPRDILEYFIWVKGGNRLTYYMMTFVHSSPTTLGDILESYL